MKSLQIVKNGTDKKVSLNNSDRGEIEKRHKNITFYRILKRKNERGDWEIFGVAYEGLEYNYPEKTEELTGPKRTCFLYCQQWRGGHKIDSASVEDLTKDQYPSPEKDNFAWDEKTRHWKEWKLFGKKWHSFDKKSALRREARRERREKRPPLPPIYPLIAILILFGIGFGLKSLFLPQKYKVSGFVYRLTKDRIIPLSNAKITFLDNENEIVASGDDGSFYSFIQKNNLNGKNVISLNIEKDGYCSIENHTINIEDGVESYSVNEKMLTIMLCLQGSVYDKLEKRKIAGARITLLSADGEPIKTIFSTNDGFFYLNFKRKCGQDLLHLEVTHEDYKPEVVQIVPEDATIEHNIELLPKESGPEACVTVTSANGLALRPVHNVYRVSRKEKVTISIKRPLSLNGDLSLIWRAHKGRTPSIAGFSNVYTAPATSGIDYVVVDIWSEKTEQGHMETIQFNVSD